MSGFKEHITVGKSLREAYLEETELKDVVFLSYSDKNHDASGFTEAKKIICHHSLPERLKLPENYQGEVYLLNVNDEKLKRRLTGEYPNATFYFSDETNLGKSGFVGPSGTSEHSRLLGDEYERKITSALKVNEEIKKIDNKVQELQNKYGLEISFEELKGKTKLSELGPIPQVKDRLKHLETIQGQLREIEDFIVSLNNPEEIKEHVIVFNNNENPKVELNVDAKVLRLNGHGIITKSEILAAWNRHHPIDTFPEPLQDDSTDFDDESPTAVGPAPTEYPTIELPAPSAGGLLDEDEDLKLESDSDESEAKTRPAVVSLVGESLDKPKGNRREALITANNTRAAALERAFPYLELGGFKHGESSLETEEDLEIQRIYLTTITYFTEKNIGHQIKDKMGFSIDPKEGSDDDGYYIDLMMADKDLVARLGGDVSSAKLVGFLECCLLTDLPVDDPEYQEEDFEEVIKKLQHRFNIRNMSWSPVLSLIDSRPLIVNNLVAGFKLFFQSQQFNPDLEINLSDPSSRAKLEEVNGQKTVNIDFTSSPEEIAQTLRQAHEQWPAAALGQPAAPASAASEPAAAPAPVPVEVEGEVFDRQKAMAEFKQRHPLIENLVITGATDGELESVLAKLDQALNDPEVKEIIKKHYINNFYIGAYRQVEYHLGGFKIPSTLENHQEVIRAIIQNKNKFIERPGIDDVDLGDPEEEEFDPVAAIDAIEKKYKVHILYNREIPKEDLKIFLAKLDQALADIPELGEIFSLSIIIKPGSFFYIDDYTNSIKMGLSIDPSLIAKKINQSIEQRKRNKQEAYQAYNLAQELQGHYGLLRIDYSRRPGEWQDIQNLEQALNGLRNPEALRGKSIDVPAGSSVEGIQSILEEIIVQDALRLVEAQAARDAALPFEKMSNLEKPETEPVVGRMYQDASGNLQQIRTMPQEGDPAWRFAIFDYASQHRKIITLAAFKSEVEAGRLTIVAGTEGGINPPGEEEIRLATIGIDNYRKKGVARLEHWQYYINETLANIERVKGEIRSQIDAGRLVDPDLIEQLQRFQVIYQLEIKEQDRFIPDPRWAGQLVYRSSKTSIMTQAEAISLITNSSDSELRLVRQTQGVANIERAYNELEALWLDSKEFSEEQIEKINARQSAVLAGSPEHLFLSEQLAYWHLRLNILNQPLQALPSERDQAVAAAQRVEDDFIRAERARQAREEMIAEVGKWLPFEEEPGPKKFELDEQDLKAQELLARFHATISLAQKIQEQIDQLPPKQQKLFKAQFDQMTLDIFSQKKGLVFKEEVGGDLGQTYANLEAARRELVTSELALIQQYHKEHFFSNPSQFTDENLREHLDKLNGFISRQTEIATELEGLVARFAEIESRLLALQDSLPSEPVPAPAPESQPEQISDQDLINKDLSLFDLSNNIRELWKITKRELNDPSHWTEFRSGLQEAKDKWFNTERSRGLLKPKETILGLFAQGNRLREKIQALQARARSNPGNQETLGQLRAAVSQYAALEVQVQELGEKIEQLRQMIKQ